MLPYDISKKLIVLENILVYIYSGRTLMQLVLHKEIWSQLCRCNANANVNFKLQDTNGLPKIVS